MDLSQDHIIQPVSSFEALKMAFPSTIALGSSAGLTVLAMMAWPTESVVLVMVPGLR